MSSATLSDPCSPGRSSPPLTVPYPTRTHCLNTHQRPSMPFLSHTHRPLFSKLLAFSSSASMWVSQKPRLRGLIFDMDGTLTVPVIDFAAMYRAVLGEEEYARVRRESPAGIDILHHIEKWEEAEQRRAYEVIAEYEKMGLDRLQIMPGWLLLDCGFEYYNVGVKKWRAFLVVLFCDTVHRMLEMELCAAYVLWLSLPFSF